MSFGFGSNNNNSTFGGFGSSNTGGFGASNNASTGGSLFGGNTATAGGFGGFGANNNQNTNNSPFGANKATFGATNTTSSGGGLFGSNTATSGGFGGGGGFGNTANTGSGFGGSTGGGGGLFGQNKPATTGFGASNTGTSLFGNSNTSGGFGASNTTSNPFSTNTNTNANAGGFGASNTGGGFAFGGQSQGAQNNNNSGTGSTPFSEFNEKDAGVNGAVSKYQSITFQQPYAQKSFEELRLEDYAQGRQKATTNGQAGGFGQSTGFGNFGASNNTSTGGGLFGGNTATSGTTGFGGGNTGGFGSNTTNTGGMFGNTANTGGGLFGAQQSKPATTSLFGTTNTNNTTGGFGNSTNTGGGLFGGGGSFGSTTNTNTGGGLFGNNQQQQQQQNKPAFGGFGSTTNNNTTGGFGQSTSTGGGLFGNTSNTNTGGGLFGQNNQQQQQQQQSNPFGASTNTGGGLFGGQNKPATGGLFGNTANTNTGGGLFGAQNNQQQSNPFGGSTNTTGGLFGNQNQAKPQGTGLFGGSTNQNAGGGLFGAQNNQQAGSSLFGNNNAAGSSLFGNQNKPAGGSLFGNTQNNNTNIGGMSLFGNNQNQQTNTGGGLFGGSLGQNNQNQQNANTSSLFGGSFGQSNQQGTPQQQNQLHATLTGAPYGNEQLFSSLGAASPPVGPLATPLTGARPPPRKTPSLLASARLNTPVYSPRAGSIGRNGGYGFSYSTYGTPGSAFTSGSLTPGASSLLRPTGSLGSALTGRLNKSLSTSNLRGDGGSSDGRSLLRPAAFSPDGTPGFQNGSVRKLKIDRSLRTDLFGANRTIEAAKESEAPGLKKRVSFENAGAESTAEPTATNALVRTEEPEEEASPAGLLRAGPERPRAPEMEQVGNGTLTTVPEDTEVARPSSAPGMKASEKSASKKTEVGDYWTKPAMKDLKHMSRQQLKNVGNFVVGRENVGRIEFGSVDLTNTPLEDICGGIVKLNPRSATVYENDNDKPAVGRALNVPSTIYLENSWPRSHGGKMPVHAKSGKAYDKHIARLKRVSGTRFLNYNADTGVWSFAVEHFTTYGLDDDDDDASELFDESQMQQESSELSEPPQTPTDQHDETVQSVATGTGEMEDTFQFKLDQRSRLSNIPGGFDEEGVSYDYDDPSADEGMDEDEHMMSGGLGYEDENESDPFLDHDASAPPVQAPRQQVEEIDRADVAEKETEMPGSFVEPKVPKSILKPTATLSAFASPEKIANESWEERLQATRSPKKRDRQVLKEMQKELLRARADDVIESPFKKSMMGLAQGDLDESYLAQRSAKKSKLDTGKKQLGESQNLRTAMDIMNSIYASETKGRKIAAGGKGFEYPYPKRARLSSNELSSQDAEWHDSLKPSFSNNGIFTYAVPGSAPQPSGELVPAMPGFVGEHYDVRFARFMPAADVDTGALKWQMENTTYDSSGSFPHAQSPVIPFFSLAKYEFSAGGVESSIWHLCSILFDDVQHAVIPEYLNGIPEDRLDEFEDLLRLDIFKEFWHQLVAPHAQEGLKRARSPEEKAIYYLSMNDVTNACETLIAAKDFKLAAMVAQLPGSQRSRSMMSEQIEAWKNRNDWSEMSEPIRAIYSILAGEVCSVQGKNDTTENRISEFSLSKRFALNWQQSFAFRLFFGGHQSIGAVIEKYTSDLDSGREAKEPLTRSPDGKETNDVVFEILTLTQDQSTAVFDPLTVSGSALNSRLAWQLTSLLNAHSICSTPQERLNQLTHDFAIELENDRDLVTSVWALLHIGDAADSDARLRAVTAVLNRNGGAISTPDVENGANFQELAQHFHIPTSLIWTAKALYARAGLRNPALELEWLVNGGDVDAAHEILCSTLGPQAVIEQDYDVLSRSLQLFPRRLPDGWQRGGQVYLDFVRLVNGRSRQRLSPDDEAAMKRLRRGLAEMEEDVARLSQVERVAVYEMCKVLDDVVREHHGKRKDTRMSGMEDGDEPSLGSEMLARYQQAMGISA